MNAIVEVTCEDDLERLETTPGYLGVNSRDLETLTVDLSRFARLRPLLPDTFLIAESGIRDLETLRQVRDLGYHGALIGEHFLRAAEPGAELARFTQAVRSRPRVKICGITSVRDALMAVELGAEALGFVFADSPRRIDPDALRQIRPMIPSHVLCVGVFAGQPRERVLQAIRQFSLDVAQVYEPVDLPLPTWQARTVTHPEEVNGIAENGRLLWDVKAPADRVLDVWSVLARRPIFALAGGLAPDNVALGIALCRPQWVDVARGVESARGIKDENKLRQFMRNVT